MEAGIRQGCRGERYAEIRQERCRRALCGDPAGEMQRESVMRGSGRRDAEESVIRGSGRRDAEKSVMRGSSTWGE
jgi:hypothetical protein